MKVNGSDIQLNEDLTLAKFLENSGYNITRIAVELNGDIVPKAEYESVVLNPEDTLEIVQFVGGG